MTTGVFGTFTDQFIESSLNPLVRTNENLGSSIVQELSQCHMKKVDIATPPQDFFEHSPFWDYAPEGVMLDWNYCLSRLLSKEEVIPGVFIGTETYALVAELVNGDYVLKSNEFYAEKDPSMHLIFKNGELEQTWPNIKARILGLENPQVDFTRIISITKNASDELLLRGKLEQLNGYSAIKMHKIVQLRDLPQNATETQDQIHQWDNLTREFNEIFSMIDDARIAQEPILIHCKAGRHRSVAILAAYLIDRLGLTARQALDYIRTKRACAVHYERSEFSKLLTELEK